MSIQYAKFGEAIPLLLGSMLSASKTTTLVKTGDLELIRLILPAGKEIPTHKAPGVRSRCNAWKEELLSRLMAHHRNFQPGNCSTFPQVSHMR